MPGNTGTSYATILPPSGSPRKTRRVILSILLFDLLEERFQLRRHLLERSGRDLDLVSRLFGDQVVLAPIGIVPIWKVGAPLGAPALLALQGAADDDLGGD